MINAIENKSILIIYRLLKKMYIVYIIGSLYQISYFQCKQMDIRYGNDWRNNNYFNEQSLFLRYLH